jgi:hypothetical protein
MTPAERDVALAELNKELAKVHHAKSTDYAGKEDVLANFKRIAEKTGLTKYQVWSVYFNKHIEAICNSIKHNSDEPQVESEPLEERVVDAIVYLKLFHFMRVEDKAKRQKKKLKADLAPQVMPNPEVLQRYAHQSAQGSGVANMEGVIIQ